MHRKTSKLVNMISVILATVALIMTGYLVVGMVRPLLDAPELQGER